MLTLPVVARADDSDAMQFAARYPKGSISSVEMADRALAESEKVRAASEAQHTAEERACYDKFFATACLDKVKERRHDESTAIRQVELEASAFKRRARVDEREQAMKEREAKRAAEPAAADDRVQRHEEKMKMLQEQDAKQEEQRRKNVAAYEQKQRDVEQRQRDAERRQREAEQQKTESGQQNKGTQSAR
jgi:hypothetical protein